MLEENRTGYNGKDGGEGGRKCEEKVLEKERPERLPIAAKEVTKMPKGAAHMCFHSKG